MVNGNTVRSDILSNLASILIGNMITTEKKDMYEISSATSDAWGIDLTLQSSLTVNAGPHWFEVTDGS